MPISRPAVTVGVPVYNGADFVEEALDSIRRQSLEDIEILVSDNASTDRTRELCERVAGDDPRIRVLVTDVNRGLAWNWNRVLEEARAPLFRWACHDDLLHPDLLRVCAAAVDDAPPDVMLVFPQTVDVDLEGQEIERYDDDLDLREPTAHERLAHQLRTLRRCNPLFGVMRTESLRAAGGMPPHAHGDQILLGRLALAGRWRALDQPLFYRRVHPGMSLIVYPTPADLARLYDSSSTRRFYLPYTRVYCEHARSIAGANLPLAEKVRCWEVLAREWRFYRTIAGETKQALKRLAKLY